MPEDSRFLLGYGERLTRRVAPPGGGGGSDPAYTFDEAVERLSPMVQETSRALEGLPSGARPGGQAVGVITLHPQWMAKSYHPQQLLSSYALRQVGSRPVEMQPDKWTRSEEPSTVASSELFVAGPLSSFQRWSQDLEEVPNRVSEQIRRLESVRSPDAADRVKGLSHEAPQEGSLLLEVVLHASEGDEDEFIVSGFSDYAESLGIAPELDRRFYAGGLCFLPVVAPEDAVEKLAEYAFLRVARPMPRLRSAPAIERSFPAVGLPDIALPIEDAVDRDLRIALFDGGLAAGGPLSRWASSHDTIGIGAATPDCLTHGHSVTSAALFGSLIPGDAIAPRPFALVDHFRVYDDQAAHDPFELYDVLRRIDETLKSRRYDFFNLSIGPDLPIEDDEVHSWTALLDAHLSDGNALATIAIGNSGERSAPGDSRIQPPSDCVNALAVGAADTVHSSWSKATYSSVGPGRSPGVTKPDVVHFGGSGQTGTEQFVVYDQHTAPALNLTAGTSFAAPATLRLAAGLRAHFGARFTPMALKALIVHSAERGARPPAEVGWGRVGTSLESMVLCDDGMVRIVYQGQLSPSQYLRAEIPLPENGLTGNVAIAATFCYACRTDPQDPGSYTRSGLDITFRPHSQRFSTDESTDPKSASFFKRSDFETEQALRNDAQKWETTLHASKTMRSTSLSVPVFDIHYNARMSGGVAREADKINYSLVVTVRAGRVRDLYDQVVRAYAGRLEVFSPIIEIPVRV